jgi:hypothetical protein
MPPSLLYFILLQLQGGVLTHLELIPTYVHADIMSAINISDTNMSMSVVWTFIST